MNIHTGRPFFYSFVVGVDAEIVSESQEDGFEHWFAWGTVLCIPSTSSQEGGAFGQR